MCRIFISYRRADSGGWAGHLSDLLKRRFGVDQVFQDISIGPGQVWLEAIKEAGSSSGVLIALIGPNWLKVTDPRTGRPRLEDPKDVLRREIATALKGGVFVIPVLVGDAAMPNSEDLPEDLKALADRQGHRLSDTSWEYDSGRLITALEEQLGKRAVAEDVPPTSISPAPKKLSRKAIVSLVSVPVGSLFLAQGPGAPFPEYLTREGAVAMILLSCGALALAISALADVKANKVKGKILAITAIAISSFEILGLGLPLLSS